MGFGFEIFAQPLPVYRQYAFRHMIVEHRLLKKKGSVFQKRIIELKSSGLSTEEAFAALLNLSGEFYEALLCYE